VFPLAAVVAALTPASAPPLPAVKAIAGPVLQALEGLKLVEKDANGGRRLTSQVPYLRTPIRKKSGFEICQNLDLNQDMDLTNFLVAIY